MVSNKGTGATVMVNDFTIGCDPEFAMLDGMGQVIRNQLREGPIGPDHGGNVVELHPEPTRGTYALTKRIQRLIKDPILQQFAAAKFRAGAHVQTLNDGGRTLSLGGHFHYGITPIIPPDQAYGNLVDPNPNRIRALDMTTKLLEFLDILPQNECRLRRQHRNGYGRFGCVRPSGNGEGLHLEYRTMASWLFDPKVAFTCLTAAKLAAAEPEATLEALRPVTSFEGLKTWVRRFHARDSNAKRLTEKVLDRGLPALQVDPDVDFRERWEDLGL